MQILCWLLELMSSNWRPSLRCRLPAIRPGWPLGLLAHLMLSLQLSRQLQRDMGAQLPIENEAALLCPPTPLGPARQLYCPMQHHRLTSRLDSGPSVKDMIMSSSISEYPFQNCSGKALNSIDFPADDASTSSLAKPRNV